MVITQYHFSLECILHKTEQHHMENLFYVMWRRDGSFQLSALNGNSSCQVLTKYMCLFNVLGLKSYLKFKTSPI